MLRLSPEVSDALRERRPIVALESTLIAHGLPSPHNLETAFACEEVIRAQGAVPATCAVLAGQPCVGLSRDEIASLAQPCVEKASSRDLAWLLASRATGATTVAASVALAHRAGIPFFATGGIGGLHRGPLDLSADLYAISRARVAVVSSGVKSILDVEGTLEALEALSVPVIGYQTSTFPRFYVESGPAIERRLDTPEAVANYLHAHFSLGIKHGVLLAQSAPKTLPEKDHDAALSEALQRAEAQGIKGKASTPFLLGVMRELLGEAALDANVALIIHNARSAAAFALAFSQSA
jgi:pseudouridine-5'-phosphate glycosidase